MGNTTPHPTDAFCYTLPLPVNSKDQWGSPEHEPTACILVLLVLFVCIYVCVCIYIYTHTHTHSFSTDTETGADVDKDMDGDIITRNRLTQ